MAMHAQMRAAACASTHAQARMRTCYRRPPANSHSSSVGSRRPAHLQYLSSKACCMLHVACCLSHVARGLFRPLAVPVVPLRPSCTAMPLWPRTQAARMHSLATPRASTDSTARHSGALRAAPSFGEPRTRPYSAYGLQQHAASRTAQHRSTRCERRARLCAP